MGKPPCRDVSTTARRPLPPLSSLRPLSSLPSLCSLPAPTHTLRQRYRRGQLLAVGANAMGLAQSVGLLLSTDRLVEGGGGKRRPLIAAVGSISKRGELSRRDHHQQREPRGADSRARPDPARPCFLDVR